MLPAYVGKISYLCRTKSHLQMKILITGAGGQLGSELAGVLPGRLPGAELVFTDAANLDITDATAVDGFVSNGGFTHIVNCAAYTAVDRAEEDKALCTAVNVDAVGYLAAAAENCGARMLHISTDYVFDGRSCTPYTESDLPAPRSHYGVTKRRSETLLLGLLPEAIIIRTGWLYSSYGKNFVKTMLRLAAANTSVNVVCDQIGTPTYARDLAEAIAAIIAAPQWIPGIYHFADEGVASWYDFAQAVFDISGTACKAVPIPTADYPTAAERPSFSVLDKSKIKATYGIEIPHWRHSLAHCIECLGAQADSANQHS